MTSRTRRAADWPYVLPPSDSTRVGISFSGGGIRSATFSLGVYQRLIEEGIFQRAQFLSAVSGGSYLASGLAISHADPAVAADPSRPAPWGRGSAEEARLRQNLSYLAPGGAGRIWLAANLVCGVVLNLVPLVLGAWVIGQLLGLLLAQLYPGLGHGSADVAVAPWVVGGVGLAVVAAMLVVCWRRFSGGRRSMRSAPRVESHSVATGLLAAAASVVLLLGVLPLLVHHLGNNGSDGLVAALGIDGLDWWLQRVVLGTTGVAVALSLGGIAVWLLRRRRFHMVQAILAPIAGSAVLLVPFVLAAETGADPEWSFGSNGWTLTAAFAVIVLFAMIAHNRRYSMHLFYRERLQEAFASRRGADDPEVLESIPYAEAICLSKIAAANEEGRKKGRPFPELIVCAAVAARGCEVPNKTWAASYTFEGETSGNARLGLQASTKDLEKENWVSGGGLTLPSMMAISGAALSPLMGRFTLPAFRFLMAMMNIRLGVWVRRRDDASPAPNRFVGALRCLKRCWEEPGAWYVLKEGLGLAGVGGKFVYVSDGGHWENLGLTELLRRGCTDIIAVDASGSKTLGDIARAMSVARAELGVEFRLDPRATAQGEDGLASTPVAVGEFTYPDGTHGSIYYARCVLWNEAPSDLQMFCNQERRFPNHPTSNQFLSGEVFDAYRALGFSVGKVLVDNVHLQPEPPAMPTWPNASSGRFEREVVDQR